MNDHIFIKRGNYLEKLSYKDIHFIEVEKKDCEINTSKGKFIIQASLKEVLTRLPLEFMQVHRSFIVNTSHIVKYHFKDNSLLMPSGKYIDVSCRQKEKLMSFFNRL